MSAGIPGIDISFAQLFVAIFSGTFGLLGLIFLGIGVGIAAAQNKKRNLCTAYADGTVSAVQGQNGSGLRAVYNFTIDGKPMQYFSSYSGSNGLLVGQPAGVYYDPENIGRVYIEEDARQLRLFARIFSILGSVFAIIALLVALIVLGVL
jgi:hypothetical protein